MAATARAPEVLVGRNAARPEDVLPAVLDDFSLVIDHEGPTVGGQVPSSTARWVGRIRRIADAKLRLWGMTVLVDDALLVISALVTNGLRYATCRQIVFRLASGAQTLVVVVDDGSPGRPEPQQIDLDAENGRGLAIVSALAVSWGVSDDGTCTWCVLTVPTARRRALFSSRTARPSAPTALPRRAVSSPPIGVCTAGRSRTGLRSSREYGLRGGAGSRVRIRPRVGCIRSRSR